MRLHASLLGKCGATDSQEPYFIQCLLLNELIFRGAAIYSFIAGLHVQHMIFSHSCPENSLHLKPQTMARMLMQPLWDFLIVLQKLCKN